jgi:formyltetrahydrofolate deformylase
LNAIGKDKPGMNKKLTDWFYKHKGNIAECEAYTFTPTIASTLFGTHFKVEIEESNAEEIKRKLKELCNEIHMKNKVVFEDEKETKKVTKKVCLLTTKEKHCVEAILRLQPDLSIEVAGIIGTDDVIKPLAQKYDIDFDLVDIPDKSEHDKKIFELIEKKDPDFIILPRYIRKIMDLEFLWLYRNLIINIHPSILPAFPGANAYDQAYHDKKVHIHGATAHFINEKMDEGPIIWQESYQRVHGEDYASFVKRGREIEKKALLYAVYLFANDRVTVAKDAVNIKSNDHISNIMFENFSSRCIARGVLSSKPGNL